MDDRREAAGPGTTEAGLSRLRRLTADVTGEVETDEGVLVIRRIHVAMRLAAPEGTLPTVERVHGVYAMRCPLYRTLHTAIALSSSIEVIG